MDKRTPQRGCAQAKSKSASGERQGPVKATSSRLRTHVLFLVVDRNSCVLSTPMYLAEVLVVRTIRGLFPTIEAHSRAQDHLCKLVHVVSSAVFEKVIQCEVVDHIMRLLFPHAEEAE